MSNGTFIRLWEEHGEVAVDVTYAEPLGLALEAWVERNMDSVVSLRTLSGDLYKTKASNIDSFMVSTPEGRRRTLELEKAQGDEKRQIRHDIGLPWEDE